MKRFVYFVLFIMILSLLPITAYAENDVISDVKAFFDEQGRDHDGRGHAFYRADMNGGGTFNIELIDNDKAITCWIEDSQTDGDSFYKYEFAIILKPPNDCDIEWMCLISDENGTNTANGKMAASDNVSSELTLDEYAGDDYLKKSLMENAHNFRDALILAIANDLNYYFDKNLDYFGINPQFFCIDGHSFGEWVYQKNATKQANGTEKRQCATCFATEEREVEGTMIEVPTGSVTESAPVEQPETQEKPEQQPQTEALPETQEKTEQQAEIPDYQFELQETQTDEDDDTEKTKNSLPPYLLPTGIVLAVIVVGVVIFFVVKTKRTEKQDDDEDLFGI